MALNFWHSGGSFSDLELIGRPSTSLHRSIYKRLKALLLSDVQFPASSMVRAGRRFPQLLARLGELSEAVTFQGITSQPDTKDFEGIPIQKRSDLLLGLDPYKKADAERIKISGKGHWDVTSLLPDELCMAYRDPAVIFNGRQVPEGLYPRIGETPEDIASLARLWDSHGLLHLHDFNVPDFDPQRQVRIFGAMKDLERDRQIGDRRGMNFKENRIIGPSSNLPNGSDLTDRMIDPASHRIHICVCDRKDFYHQIMATRRRAITNSLGPGVPMQLLEGTQALNTYLLDQSMKKRKRNRTEMEDHLHSGSGLLLPSFEDDRGAVLEAEVDPVVNEVLFKAFKTKGAYTRLQTPEEVLTQRLGIAEADEEESPGAALSVDRPLAYRFDFVELFAGAAKVSSYIEGLGFSTCVPIELSLSEEFNLKWPHVQSWVVYLITNKLIKGLMVEPPCTTFSIMRRPPLRSFEEPFGFQVEDPQTMDGNILAHRGLQLLWMCGVYYVLGLLETPWSSKMRYLPAWRVIESKAFARVTRVDSCQYGSPHLESFRLLSVHMEITHAAARCRGGHYHVPVEGAYTKASATYTDQLSLAIAMDFKESMMENEGSFASEELPTEGLDGFLPNEVMLTSRWRIKYDWAFNKESHINLLEMRSVLRLVMGILAEKRKVRMVSFIDSNVCRCAI